MKRSELIKGFFLGLMVVGLVLFGSLPAMAQGNSGTAHPIAPPIERPLSDFLDVQGTFCFPDGAGGCRIFNPPLPNYLLWNDVDRSRRAAIDYAGMAAEYALSQGLDFGTEITGFITEEPLSDGRAQVTVILHTKNAFTWVTSGNSTFTSPVIFGNRIAEVLDGAEPALGDCTFKIDFRIPFPGAPLLDLVQLLGFQSSINTLRSLTFTASALGELHAEFGVPEGTSGAATVIQLNNQFNSIGPVDPVSNILVHPGN
jgi:hypothetical protein